MTDNITSSGSQKKKFWETFGIAAGGGAVSGIVVSALVAGIVNFYALSVLENRKARVEEIVHTESAWDNAQANIFAQLAVFNNNIFANRKIDRKQRQGLLEYIVKTQLTLVRLQDKLGLGDQVSIKEYNEELQKLSATIRTASTVDQVGTVLDSTARLFELHDKVEQLVAAKTDISGL